jgi:hypothetical protein
MGPVGTWFMISTYRNSRKLVGTGEHGVGVGKKEYLVDELGEGTVELMRIIKEAVDPLNLLNPGKVKSSSMPCLQQTYPCFNQLYPERCESPSKSHGLFDSR